MINKVTKQYILVFSGNIFTMVFGFLTSIVATYIMIPEEYGFYKAYLISLQTLATLMHLGFHYSIGRMYAKSNNLNSIKKLNAITFSLILSISLISLAIVTILNFISKTYFDYSIPNYILISSWTLMVILSTFFSQQKLQGQNEMGKYVLFSLLPQFLFTIFFVINFLIGKKISGEIAVYSYAFFNALSLISILKEGYSKFDLSSLKKIFIQNKDYGFNLYLGSLVTVTVSQLLTLLIASLAGLEEYGFFSLGISLASPIAYVASTLGIVQFKKNIGEKKIHNKELFGTVILTLVISLIYFIFLKYFMVNIISDNYKKAIPYANILILFYIMTGLGDYLNKFLGAKGEGKRIRNASITSGLFLIVFSAILIPILGIKGLIMSKLLGSLTYLYGMIQAYRKTINSKEAEKL